MSQTGLPAFDSTIQTTNSWLHEVAERMQWFDRRQAYDALRAALHALRDRLNIDQAAALGAQLPMLVRGFYYEGWHPAGKPLKERHRAAFLAHVAEALPRDLAADAEEAARAVFAVLARHVSGGEIEHVKNNLPAEVRSLWPE